MKKKEEGENKNNQAQKYLFKCYFYSHIIFFYIQKDGHIDEFKY